ncbi:ABC transporter permease [Lysinibacillus sp. RC79]|uniref:ABC transporter permease n=1 Tax=Lysinibacillus sp. RC79 TaxID=3156296 RepID=UPI003517CDA7
MKIFWIAIKDLKLTFFDWKALLILIITPLVLILILGNALAGTFEDNSTIEKFTVAVVHDPNQQNEKLLKQVKENAEKFIHIEEMNKQEAKAEVESGEIPVMVLIPEQITKSNPIFVQHNVKSELQGKITEQVFNQVLQGANLIEEAYKIASENSDIDLQPVNFQQNGFDEKNRDISEILFKKNSSFEDRKTVSSFQYYAAGISVMFILLTGMSGLSSIIEEQKLGTYSRIRTATLSLPSYLTGKWLSTTVTCLLQFIILYLGTSYIFDITWGDHIEGLFLLIIAYIFGIGGIVIFLTTFITTQTMVNIFRGVGVQIMVLLGGSMIPVQSFPEKLQYAAYITPNYWALNGILDLMGGKNSSDIVFEIIILLCIGLLTFSIGYIRLSKREGENLG